MKKITQSMEYQENSMLTQHLKEFHEQHPFQTGIDLEFDYMYAIMTDQDCLAFCLRHPEYSNKFKAA
jgi:hypothetical protein